MVGSAPVARRWLMIEVMRAWESQPLETPPITEAQRAVLEEAERAHNGRVMLVRRPGRSLERDLGRWWAVDTLTGHQVEGQWTCSNDLDVAAHALGEPLSLSTEYAAPAILVCTHGTRDVCCAIDGRQVARTLAATWPDDVWECTHLGGHRFAPTFALLPDGAVYGRVRHEDAVEVVTAHRAGHVPASRLRGISRWEPPVQAAIVAALQRFGPAGLHDVTVLSTEHVDEHAWSVRLGGEDPIPETVVVRVQGTEEPPHPLSCPPAKDKPSTTYAVVSVDVEE
jgi:hypothetical protein